MKKTEAVAALTKHTARTRRCRRRPYGQALEEAREGGGGRGCMAGRGRAVASAELAFGRRNGGRQQDACGERTQTRVTGLINPNQGGPQRAPAI